MTIGAGLIFAIIAIWILWPRSEQEPEQEPPQVSPGILAWEQDCAARKAAGQWKWGRR